MADEPDRLTFHRQLHGVRTLPLDGGEKFRFCSGMGRIANISLHRYDSWGSIERLGLPIRAQCETCGTILKVDVKVVIALRGRSGSPVNVRTPCKVFGCDGWMVFQGTWGGTLNTPWRNLRSD